MNYIKPIFCVFNVFHDEPTERHTRPGEQVSLKRRNNQDNYMSYHAEHNKLIRVRSYHEPQNQKSKHVMIINYYKKTQYMNRRRNLDCQTSYFQILSDSSHVSVDLVWIQGFCSATISLCWGSLWETNLMYLV